MNQLDIKTSTGLPTHQGYTPPIGEAHREPLKRFQQPSALESLFPQETKSKRPLSDTIRKPLSQVANILSNVRNFPEFFDHLEKIETGESGETKWHFRKGSELIVPMKRIATENTNLFIWRTEDNAGFDYTLAIELLDAQSGRGTIARIMTSYNSKASGLLAKLEGVFGEEASVLARKNLQRFKAYCETGHVPTIEGQPSGRDDDSYILSPNPEQTVLKH